MRETCIAAQVTTCRGCWQARRPRTLRSERDHGHAERALRNHAQTPNRGAGPQLGLAPLVFGQAPAVLLVAGGADLELAAQVDEVSDVLRERLGEAARVHAVGARR